MKHLTVRQAAEQLQCSVKTVRSGVKSGAIKSIRPTPRVIRIVADALTNTKEES